MAWTGYTPIYVRTTGNDANNGLSVGSPKLTVQSAFDAAYAAGSGNYVLDIGTGSFTGVTASSSNGWPSRIGIRGISTSASTIASITGDLYGRYAFNILSDNTVTITSIINSSTNQTYGSFPGGTVSLSSCTTGNIDVSSGYISADGVTGTGGTVTLTSSTVGAINASSGSAYYNNQSNTGNGGTVTLISSTAGAINTNSGSAYQNSGSSGSVSLTNSTAGTISTAGGIGSYNNSGSGGAVSLTSSTAGNINTFGSNASVTSGSGGAVTLTVSTAGNITTSSGYGNTSSGSGGAVTLTSGSTVGDISTSSAYSNNNVGSPGSVSLTNSTAGNITATKGTQANYYGTAVTAGGSVSLTSSTCKVITTNGNGFPGSVSLNNSQPTDINAGVVAVTGRFKYKTTYTQAWFDFTNWSALDIVGASNL